MEWQIEHIPNEDKVYMRINRKNSHPSDYKIHPGVFAVKGYDGLSTDWQKYSTPAESHARSSIPEDNGVVSVVVSDVREIKILSVEHKPILINRSHSVIIGIPSSGLEKTRVRNLLANIVYIEIPIPLN